MDAEDPVAALCNKIIACTSAKGEEWREALGLFEQLQGADVSLCFDSDLLAKAWGRSILAAERVGAGREHSQELVADFEGRVGIVSPYLVALMSPENDPVAGLRAMHKTHGLVSPDAVDGFLERCQNDATAVMALWKEAASHGIQPSTSLLESIQKVYGKRMTSEDPAVVIAEMEKDSVPLSTMHFNIVIHKATDSSKTTPLEWYDRMLDAGIKPDIGTFRLMQKKVQKKEDYHFFKRRVNNEVSKEDTVLACQRLKASGSVAEGKKHLARLVLQGVEPNVAMYNELILCCKNQSSVAEEIYSEMAAAGLQPDGTTFASLIAVGGKVRGEDGVDATGRWMKEMNDQGVAMDSQDHAGIIESHVRANQRNKARQHFKMVAEGGSVSVDICNAMMRAGPFDWSYGCLGYLLSERLSPNGQTRAALQSIVRDQMCADMFNVLDSTRWTPQEILTLPEVANPPVGAFPGISFCMRRMLRELGCNDAFVDQRLSMLKEQIKSGGR